MSPCEYLIDSAAEPIALPLVLRGREGCAGSANAVLEEDSATSALLSARTVLLSSYILINLRDGAFHM